MKSLRERFDEKWIPVPESGCWLWTAALTQWGHGVIGTGTRTPKVSRAHRIAYELYIGEVPPDAQVNHKCDVACCVNPNHLYLGTQADNIQDCIKRKRKTDPPVHKGEANGSAKLTASQVLDILEVLRNDPRANLSRLAKRYKVHSSTIYLIKHGKKWRHLHTSDVCTSA